MDHVEDVRTAIAIRVRQARERRGWTQSQLADELTKYGENPYTQAWVSRIEATSRSGGRERRALSIEDVLMLSVALKVRVPDLVTPAGLTRMRVGQVELPGDSWRRVFRGDQRNAGRADFFSEDLRRLADEFDTSTPGTRDGLMVQVIEAATSALRTEGQISAVVARRAAEPDRRPVMADFDFDEWFGEDQNDGDDQ